MNLNGCRSKEKRRTAERKPRGGRVERNENPLSDSAPQTKLDVHGRFRKGPEEKIEQT